LGIKKNSLKSNSSNLIETALSANLIHTMDKSIKLFEDIKICADTFPEEPIMPPIFESENDLNLHNNMSVCALSVLNLINSKNMSKNKIITLNEDVKQSVKQSNYGKKFFWGNVFKIRK